MGFALERSKNEVCGTLDGRRSLSSQNLIFVVLKTSQRQSAIYIENFGKVTSFWKVTKNTPWALYKSLYVERYVQRLTWKKWRTPTWFLHGRCTYSACEQRLYSAKTLSQLGTNGRCTNSAFVQRLYSARTLSLLGTNWALYEQRFCTALVQRPANTTQTWLN